MVPPVTVPSLQTQITWMSAVQMPVQCLHSKWTGAAAESLASYPYEQLYTPSSSLAYQDVGHLQNVRYVNGSDTASIKRLILQYGSVSAPLCVNLKKYYSKSTGAYYCNNNTGTISSRSSAGMMIIRRQISQVAYVRAKKVPGLQKTATAKISAMMAIFIFPIRTTA